MGADGGFSYTKMKDFRDNWKKIKENIIAACETKSWHSPYDVEERKEIKVSVEKMPNSLENISNSDVIKMLEPFRSCDCPCIIEDFLLITGNGDNITLNMTILDDALCNYSNYIETWT